MRCWRRTEESGDRAIGPSGDRVKCIHCRSRICTYLFKHCHPFDRRDTLEHGDALVLRSRGPAVLPTRGKTAGPPLRTTTLVEASCVVAEREMTVSIKENWSDQISSEIGGSVTPLPPRASPARVPCRGMRTPAPSQSP